MIICRTDCLVDNLIFGYSLCNPYNHDMDEIYEAKHQCMIKNNVKILLTASDEIITAVKYVENKYGKKFLKSCKK